MGSVIILAGDGFLMRVVGKVYLFASSLLLAGCAEYLVVEAVGNAVYHGGKALAEMAKKGGPSNASASASKSKATGCIVGNSKYFYYYPEYCKQRGGVVTNNYNVECRYSSDRREITQEWRCKEKGGYVFAAVSPSTVTGVIESNVSSSTQSSLGSHASETSELVKCELKQNEVIVGYVEVSQRDCDDLKGI